MKRSIIDFVCLAGLAMMSLVSCNNAPAVTEPTALETIAARYSVRSYTGEKVSQEQIETLLRAAMAAPTGMNQQPWRFVVVTDPEVMDKMTNWGADTWKAAGTVIVVCGQTTMGEKNDPNPLWVMDCSAATENLLLAAKAMGLGAVWNAAYPFDDVRIPCSEALGLPENVVPLAVVPVGYESGSEEPKQKFDESKIHYGRW